MKKKDVRIGGRYYANVSGKRTIVKIIGPCAGYGGWYADNETTGRSIHVRTAQRLHGEADDLPRN